MEQSSQGSSKVLWFALGACAVVVLCCMCLLVMTGSLWALIYVSEQQRSGVAPTPWEWTFATPSPMPTLARPTVVAGATPMPVSTETLQTLQNANVPSASLSDLAVRLGGVAFVPPTVEPAPDYNVGDRKSFWVSNTDTNQNFQIEAVLRYETDHSYFWIQDGTRYNEKDLRDLAETFESKIYPTNREFFGSEWTPGIDGDPHLYILYARGLGFSLAGYFSSADSVHPLAHEYSNAHEMFVFNSDNVALDEEFTYGVLAHEFQHMIHWYQDRNETSWLNEGFSELAAFLNGYDVGGHDYSFASDPDLQLNTWPNDGDTGPHYGASFLFVTYFLDRFGEDATKALVAEQANGMTSVDLVLEQIDATDPLTGMPVRADDVFLDWTITNLVQSTSVADGRYDYVGYKSPPRFNVTETFSNCPADAVTREVHQYAADYIRINCRGSFTLRFTGSTQVGALPIDAYSGSYAFWSNRGDDSNMWMQRKFDFREVSAPIAFSYRVWYDLETDYDYVYLLASTDDGATWQIIRTPGSTDEDPSGNSYGWAYNGVTNGWQQETVDLSAFAGKQVILRFEYVTDAAVNGEGLMLDDLSIPAIGYSSDLETDSGGWETEGFVRIENVLPQTFEIALIVDGRPQTVQKFTLSADNTLEIPITLGNGSAREVTLVVAATARFTNQPATYQIELLP
ncbi:MAG: immune inhibitor A [Anaerolineales bacterium]